MNTALDELEAMLGDRNFVRCPGCWQYMISSPPVSDSKWAGSFFVVICGIPGGCGTLSLTDGKTIHPPKTKEEIDAARKFAACTHRREYWKRVVSRMIG